ncbi:hypothetical protein SAMN05216203_3367 [Marinobacter daqiaonensis]|uniref:GDSL-like Lipase/Acylhydrolase family protein n=1 Tax=Marinobacter daqiaonensis TaxID=650891 RepID=A0A1I6JVW5_9GAMM|nr:SGNH/GDSL hydrolase family protein [Marinobacter daqiaonensis]SFR83076.1 hypothetical protein SAMN05216203_3367 [Marinobacter daqiaonensis]
MLSSCWPWQWRGFAGTRCELGHTGAAAGFGAFPERAHFAGRVIVDYLPLGYYNLGVTCVETRPAFAGNESRYISSDGIHPTAAGSRVLADLILDALN